MGHASMRAALIYQHAAEDRDQGIASALSRLAAGRLAPCAAVASGRARADTFVY